MRAYEIIISHPDPERDVLVYQVIQGEDVRFYQENVGSLVDVSEKLNSTGWGATFGKTGRFHMIPLTEEPLRGLAARLPQTLSATQQSLSDYARQTLIDSTGAHSC